MAVLFDTDAFCKLGVAGLLDAVAERLGSRLEDCARLPALPYMLARGGLRKRYGDVICEALQKSATTLQVAPAASDATRELFRNLPSVDPGEAQLLALCIERGDTLVTGDKRALRAVATVPGLAQQLAGRIVLLEAVLLELCTINGEADVRAACSAAAGFDSMFVVCFSPGNPDVAGTLKSYIEDSRRMLAPIDLWNGQE